MARKLGDGVHKHLAAFADAAGTLAANLHDLDHVDTREKATANRAHDITASGRMLIACANMSAEIFDFDLMEAFDARLAELRQRFNLPEPDSPVPIV